MVVKHFVLYMLGGEPETQVSSLPTPPHWVPNPLGAQPTWCPTLLLTWCPTLLLTRCPTLPSKPHLVCCFCGQVASRAGVAIPLGCCSGSCGICEVRGPLHACAVLLGRMHVVCEGHCMCWDACGVRGPLHVLCCCAGMHVVCCMYAPGGQPLTTSEGAGHGPMMPHAA